MNNEYDDFKDILENTKVEIEKPEFKLSQIKVEHFYYNFDNADDNTPLSTSIELKQVYDKDIQDKVWYKSITNTYINPINHNETVSESYSENIPNINELLKALEKFDLRDLKNNYYSEDENNTHWSITYNNEFKITGTYNQEIEEFKNISKLLNLKEEIKKIINK